MGEAEDWVWMYSPFASLPDVLFNGPHIISSIQWGGLQRVAVMADAPFAKNRYHCWQVTLEALDDEMMVGIATMDARYLGLRNSWERLGRDEHSWVLSVDGSTTHNSVKLIHPDYRMPRVGHIAVHLDLIHSTLMFAVNNRLLGFQYKLPKDKIFYPVLGITENFRLTTVALHSAEPTLLLLSLLAHISASCKAANPLPAKTSRKRAACSLLWPSVASVDRSQLPPGLDRTCNTLFPYLISDLEVVGSGSGAPGRNKLPRVVRIKDLAQIEALRMKRRSTRVVRRLRCPNFKDGDPPCPCDTTLGFLRKREEGYANSSDEEIFPEAARQRKERERLRAREEKKNKKKAKQRARVNGEEEGHTN